MSYNKAIGEYGERIARKFLLNKGYRIVESNLKLSYKEIDLIAFMGDVLVFVEVKTRCSDGLGGAAEALTGEKLSRMKKAAGHYLSQFKGTKFRQVRLDFIAVDIYRYKKTAKIKHFIDVI